MSTGYGLDGSGIDLVWGRDFQHPSKPGAHTASYAKGTCHSPGKSGWDVALTTHPHLALSLKKK
jgi:hypothetical protein